MRHSISILQIWLAGLLLCAPARAAQNLRPVTGIDPGQTSPAGGNGDSYAPLPSGDGRFVLFCSTADNLLPNGAPNPNRTVFPPRLNVFVRDRASNSTALVSVNLSGAGGGDGDSVPSGISTNGRYALFESAATDLVPGDTNGATDVFLRDLESGTTLLVSVNTNGVPGNGLSRNAVMTADGHYVAFVSAASDLIVGDNNGLQDVFVRDMQAGVTMQASVGAVATNTSGIPRGYSDAPELSGDGRYVAFISTASNLVAGVRSAHNIYVRDLTGESTAHVSAYARTLMSSNGVACYNHLISADGHYVVYEASGSATNGLVFRYNVQDGTTDLVHTNAAVATTPWEDIRTMALTPDGRFLAFVANTNGSSGYANCVLVWDGQNGTATLASGDPNGAVSTNSVCDWPALDNTRRYVAFLSSATNLVTNSIPGDYHLYVRDLVAGTTRLIDADTNGVGSIIGPFSPPRLTGDGRFVAFECSDASLTPNDRNRDYDVFVRDLQTDAVELVSPHDPALPSITPNGPSMPSLTSLSADGRYLAFASEADNLVPGDTNGCRDVFVRDLAAGTTFLVSVGTNGANANGPSSEPSISADGRYVAFSSMAYNLAWGKTNLAQDVYVRDREAGTTVLATMPVKTVGAGNSFGPTISSDGRFLLFLSAASNLTTNTPSEYLPKRLFLRDLQSGISFLLSPSEAALYSMTPDGRFVAYADKAAATNGSISCWDSLAGSVVSTYFGPTGLTSLGISTDGNRIICSTSSGVLQVLAFDRAAGTNGVLFPGAYQSFRFSQDGRFMVYASALLTNANQVYLYDFESGASTLVSHAFGLSDAGAGNSDSAQISPDGRFVTYRSTATNLVLTPSDGTPQVLLFDRYTGSNTLLSASVSRAYAASGRSLLPSFSGDGQTVLFESWAKDLPAQDFNQTSDLFAYTLLSVTVFPDATPHGRPWISWPVVPGNSYRVEFKNDLSDPGWQTVVGVATNAGTKAWLQDVSPTSAQRFYRVVQF